MFSIFRVQRVKPLQNLGVFCDLAVQVIKLFLRLYAYFAIAYRRGQTNGQPLQDLKLSRLLCY